MAVLTENTGGGTGLSIQANRLAVLLDERSMAADERDPMLEPKDVMQALGITEEEVGLAADELEELGWIGLDKALGMGEAGFIRIYARD